MGSETYFPGTSRRTFRSETWETSRKNGPGKWDFEVSNPHTSLTYWDFLSPFLHPSSSLPKPLLHDILTSQVVATLSRTLANLCFPSLFFESATCLLTLFRIGRHCHRGCVKKIETV